MSARAARKVNLSLPPPDAFDAQKLLALLRRHGGREYVSTLYFGGQSKGEYRLTARGELFRAQGPSGTVSELDAAGFSALFGRYHFADVRSSGVLTDLGPLFG